MLSNYIKSKEPVREKINKQIKEFLAQGKKIEVLKPAKESRPSRRAFVDKYL